MSFINARVCDTGVVQSARCDGQSQLIHPGETGDPAQQQQQQTPHHCTALAGRVMGAEQHRAGLVTACPQQQYQAAAAAAATSSLLSAAFRVSTSAGGVTSVGESGACYFHDAAAAASYRTCTPVAASYYEKCVI